MTLETAPQTQKGSAGLRILGVLVGSELWKRFTEHGLQMRRASGRNPTAEENIATIRALRGDTAS